MKNLIMCSVLFLLFSTYLEAQSKAKIQNIDAKSSLPVKVPDEITEETYAISTVAFYNLENLFDTIDTEDVRDTEFTPAGEKQWNSAKYYEKLDRLSEVLSQIGTDLNPEGPFIIGVAEVENRSVLEDLVKTPKLKDRNYSIVHYDSPDKRGVDIGLLYNEKYFKVVNSKTYTLKLRGEDNFFTRDQLLVSGIFDGEALHVIVNHWPSRRGGEKASRPKRNAAAILCRSIADSILALDKNAKIIIMGDLNDDPINVSVKEHLKAVGTLEEMKDGTLFNPFESLYKKGIGSLAWQDSWNIFDQIIISPALASTDKSTFVLHKAKIFNKKFITQDSGRYAGYPWRTYAGGKYVGGYSDHFPTYLFLIKTVKQ